MRSLKSTSKIGEDEYNATAWLYSACDHRANLFAATRRRCQFQRPNPSRCTRCGCTPTTATLLRRGGRQGIEGTVHGVLATGAVKVGKVALPPLVAASARVQRSALPRKLR